MKKKIICGIMVAMMLCCTACGTQTKMSTGNLQEEISTVLQNVSYDNLEILFDSIQHYDGQELVVSTIQRYDLYGDSSYEEMMELYLNDVFPRLMDTSEVDKSLLFDADSFLKMEDNGVSVYQKNYDDVLHSLDEYTSVPRLVYEDGENLIEVSYTADWVGGVYISLGKLGRYANSISPFSACDVIQVEKTYDCRYDDLSDSYLLMDGEKTVAEAKEEMENYLNEHYPIGGRKNGINNEIYKISVGKIAGTDYYAFTAYRTLSYNGIPFREMSPTTNVGKDEFAFMGECALCESDKVDVTVGIINLFTEPEHVRTIEEYVSFQEVMDRVAYFLTGETKFQLVYGGLEYRLMNEDNGHQMIPYWAFIAKNPNDDSMIKIYVDIETGETTHCNY